MILETTQLLNNAKIKHNPNLHPIYRETHKNHPCTLWSAKTDANFNWLNDLGLALCTEYTKRYYKIHKCEEILLSFKERDFYIPSGDLTPFVQCMPDQYKSDDTVSAYRNYYLGDKKSFAQWKNSEVPFWWK